MVNVRKNARNLRRFVKKYVPSPSKRDDLLELIDEFESVVDDIERGDKEAALDAAIELAKKIPSTAKMFRAEYHFDREALKFAVRKLAKALSGRQRPKKISDALLFYFLPNIQWLAVWAVFRSMLLSIRDDVERMIDSIEGYDKIEEQLVSALQDVRTGQDIGMSYPLNKFMNYVADPDVFDGDDDLAAEYQDAVRTLGAALDKYENIAGYVDDFGDMDLGELVSNVQATEEMMSDAADKWESVSRKLGG